MKELKDILYKSGIEEVVGSTAVGVSSICFDNRKVEKDSLFVAISGTKTDGHQFIPDAVKRGATAIVCQNLPEEMSENVTYVKVSNPAKALGIIASNFYDEPSGKLKLVGITGTNGKTTTTSLLYNLFTNLGFKCGLISTVRYIVAGKESESTHTTPDAVRLNEMIAEMVEAGCTYCFMEVSSHAIVQERIAGLIFAGGVFTNITHDHLDFHKTFAEYLRAKKAFFDQLPAGAFALYNKDDRNGIVMVQNTKASRKTFSLRSDADFHAKILENHFTGMMLQVNGQEVWTRLIGSFNAYNFLAVYGTSVLLGVEPSEVLTGMSRLTSVEGRFQTIRSEENITAIVDYAHTPDALLNVLNTLHDIRTRGEQVITVVGCGGDRDPLKRPVMARIAAEKSDRVILTSDNPRSEDPEEIIRQMKTGLSPVEIKKVLSITDRREAIRTACSFAQPGDIILVAGKGHEKYQEIKGVKHPFDDVEILKETLGNTEN